MRWMGKRMNGQLTIIEFAVMVMMGAILAVPMQIPDRGLLQGLVILCSVLILLRGINLLAFGSSRFEKLVQGEVTLLVKDGVLLLGPMKKARISHQELFSTLRERGIFQLGSVKRLYLEACGTFSLYQSETPRAGLPPFPPHDDDVLSGQTPSLQKACCRCGQLQQDVAANDSCPRYQSTVFTRSII
ncbi:MAG: hypothetical protein JWP27_2415 [Flaviaesturariibacter sp.]|nr:hypothetical protein [Flaviaesturariibacter sp.]